MSKQQLNEQLAKGILAIIQRLESAEKFALGQMPHICEEIVTNALIDNGTWLVFSSLMIGSGLGLLFMQREAAVVTGAVLLLVGTFSATCSILGLLKAKLTPKLVILETLRAMISPPKKDE